MLTDTMGMKLRHPTMHDMTNVAAVGEDPNMDQVMEMLYGLVDQVFDAEEVYDNFSREEITEFMESLNQKQFEDIMNHFQDMPGLRYEVEWTCPACGQPEKVMLEGITAFFT